MSIRILFPTAQSLSSPGIKLWKVVCVCVCVCVRREGERQSGVTERGSERQRMIGRLKACSL